MAEDQAPEKEAESRGAAFEKKAEEFAADIEGRLKGLPIPLLSLGDGACGAVGLLILYWILKALDVVSFEFAWLGWVLIGAGIFAVSLLVRYARRSAARESGEHETAAS